MPYSILIVEDDLTFATMLKTWLGKKGFLVDTAGWLEKELRKFHVC
jgi:two-component system, NtrC family, response regulator HydG